MNILRPIAPIVSKLAKIYTAKEREFSYKNIKVKVRPGVFHPGLFISTKILLDFVSDLEVENKTFLELGAGSGIISILASKKGAIVYASDISSTAVENIKINAEVNNETISVFKSDLFENLPAMEFDYIVINPPYYKKDPKIEAEFAWYCGQNHEYFARLFDSLVNHINNNSKVFMILSKVCDIDVITQIGKDRKFLWELIHRKSVLGEKNYIYNLTLK
ncbi:MAG: methyltransferase [Ignavibacteriaceae bacterium]